MNTRVIVLVLLVFSALPVCSQSLQESWMDVQQGLENSTLGDLEVRITALEETADGLRVRRMTPFAAAMVRWAEDHPGELGETVLKGAQRFDPRLPSAFFLRSRWQWNSGRYFGALGSYLAGLWALVNFENSAKIVFSSAALSLILALAVTIILTIVVATTTQLRRLFHDAIEFGGLLFSKSNAVVFAVVIVLLPLFAGFGPVWLLFYLFAMSWIYFETPARIAGIVALVVLAAIPVGLEVWQTLTFRNPAVTTKVAQMLEERQIEFSTLREFANLETSLGNDPDYLIVLGELLRMHGHPELARGRFQAASLISSRADAFIFLGSQSMEDGDVPRAIQYYNQALESDGRSVLAYLNLSTAYDLSNRFVEGDAARNKAQEIAGRRLEGFGLAGQDPRIRFPRIGADDVERLVSRLSPELKRSVGLHDLHFKLLDAALTPFAMAAWVNMILGAAILGLRSKNLWVSSACTRCGKVFCPRCKTSTESMSYCSQCISVFLKRDLVSIDQQSAKMKEIHRWELLSMLSRRVIGVLVPGSHFIMMGKVIRGFLLVFVIALLCVGASVWLPLFLASAEPLLSILPIQIALAVGIVILWAHAAIAAWVRR